MDISVHTIAFIGIFLGCLFRMLIPYLMKERKSETKINFDLKYLASAAIALIISFLVSATLIQSFTFPVNETSMLLVFSSAALQGWGSTDLFSKLGIDWREKTE